MKHLFIVICILLPLLTSAQQDYEIYRTKGDVTLRRANEKKWVKVEPFVFVALGDIINIKKGGSVCVAERSSGLAIEFTEVGAFSVRDRLKKATEKAQTKFSALNEELGKSVVKQNINTQPYVPYSSTANGERGYGDSYVADLYDSIYANLLQFSRDVKNDRNDILVEKTIVSEGIFSCSIKNNTNRTLYCNVILITDNRPSICYYIEDMDFIPLPPGTTVDLSSFPLVDNQGQYILIASEKNLSVGLLEATFLGPPILTSAELQGITFQAL